MERRFVLLALAVVAAIGLVLGLPPLHPPSTSPLVVGTVESGPATSRATVDRAAADLARGAEATGLRYRIQRADGSLRVSLAGAGATPARLRSVAAAAGLPPGLRLTAVRTGTERRGLGWLNPFLALALVGLIGIPVVLRTWPARPAPGA